MIQMKSGKPLIRCKVGDDFFMRYFKDNEEMDNTLSEWEYNSNLKFIEMEDEQHFQFFVNVNQISFFMIIRSDD